MDLLVVLLQGGDALAGLLDAVLEGHGHGPQLGHFLAAVGLLGVELGQAAFGQADEVDVLGHGLAIDDLAGLAAFTDWGVGEADLSGTLDNDVLLESALTTGLGLQGLGDLSKNS